MMAEDTTQQAARKNAPVDTLMAELQKGELSGETQGWLTIDELEAQLDITEQQ